MTIDAAAIDATMDALRATHPGGVCVTVTIWDHGDGEGVTVDHAAYIAGPAIRVSARNVGDLVPLVADALALRRVPCSCCGRPGGAA